MQLYLVTAYTKLGMYSEEVSAASAEDAIRIARPLLTPLLRGYSATYNARVWN